MQHTIQSANGREIHFSINPALAGFDLALRRTHPSATDQPPGWTSVLSSWPVPRRLSPARDCSGTDSRRETGWSTLRAGAIYSQLPPRHPGEPAKQETHHAKLSRCPAGGCPPLLAQSSAPSALPAEPRPPQGVAGERHPARPCRLLVAQPGRSASAVGAARGNRRHGDLRRRLVPAQPSLRR